MPDNIRWKQRYSNFKKSLTLLENAIDTYNNNDITHRAGIIQFYEMSFQLAWNTLQDILKYKGYDDTINGPRPVIKQAFKDNYIQDDFNWLQMLESRNLVSHAYNETIAADIIGKIKKEYLPLLQKLRTRLEQEEKNE
jgi:nucleotidyltransferase substrate binding protein (TIGR01987 family)